MICGMRVFLPLLAIYSIKQVCSELITPTLWEIGRLWKQGLIAVSIEHFASAFFRGLLTNLLYVTPSSNQTIIAQLKHMAFQQVEHKD